ncbi:MAG: hypothetical protein U0694_00585 [Anaerolineae bacterium]
MLSSIEQVLSNSPIARPGRVRHPVDPTGRWSGPAVPIANRVTVDAVMDLTFSSFQRCAQHLITCSSYLHRAHRMS